MTVASLLVLSHEKCGKNGAEFSAPFYSFRRDTLISARKSWLRLEQQAAGYLKNREQLFTGYNNSFHIDNTTNLMYCGNKKKWRKQL